MQDHNFDIKRQSVVDCDFAKFLAGDSEYESYHIRGSEKPISTNNSKFENEVSTQNYVDNGDLFHMNSDFSQVIENNQGNCFGMEAMDTFFNNKDELRQPEELKKMYMKGINSLEPSLQQQDFYQMENSFDNFNTYQPTIQNEMNFQPFDQFNDVLRLEHTHNHVIKQIEQSDKSKHVNININLYGNEKLDINTLMKIASQNVDLQNESIVSLNLPGEGRKSYLVQKDEKETKLAATAVIGKKKLKRKRSKDNVKKPTKKRKKTTKKKSISQMERIRRDIETFTSNPNQNKSFEDLANRYYSGNKSKFRKRSFRTRFRLNTGNGKLRIWKNTRILVLCSANGKNLDKCAAYKVDTFLPTIYQNKPLTVEFQLLFTHKNSSKEMFMRKIKEGEEVIWCDISENLKIKDKDQKLKVVDGKSVVCYSVKFQIKGGRNPNNSHHGIFYLLRKNIKWNGRIIAGTQFLFRRFSYKNNEETIESSFFTVDSYEQI